MQFNKNGSHSLQEKKSANLILIKKAKPAKPHSTYLYGLNAFSVSCLSLDSHWNTMQDKFQTSITTA